MSVVDGLTGKKFKGGLVAIASATSVDTFFAKRLILVAFDLPNSIAN
jgi:NAD(P)H-hydrate repair Nnr-like enzyme with NAD(P)H-hydrate epimerase domain